MTFLQLAFFSSGHGQGLDRAGLRSYRGIGPGISHIFGLLNLHTVIDGDADLTGFEASTLPA